MSKKKLFDIKEGVNCLHFEHKGVEFEARVIFEQPPNDYIPILEIWTVGYEEDGELYGYENFVGETYLDDIFVPTKYWKEQGGESQSLYEGSLLYQKKVAKKAGATWDILSTPQREKLWEGTKENMTKEGWIMQQINESSVQEGFEVNPNKTNKVINF
tara:strand:+ start:135 stop:608 length:474 start_codon:yes stop_codon:yes gene_type:complete